MTTEQKAKAYDEALERAKKNYDAAQDLCSGSQIGVECFKNTLTTIFPELKESESERIRKELIENFKWFCGDFPETTKWGKDDNLLVKDIIAWLEKQSKQETVIGKLNDANVRKEFKWDSENKIMTIYGVTYEEMKALDDFIYRLRTGMDVWYKTHGIERVTPVTRETTNGFNKSEDNESK